MTRTRALLLGLAMQAALVSTAAAQALPVPLDEATGDVLPSSSPPARQRWQALSAGERADLRARYRAWRALPEHARAGVRAGRGELVAMAPAQQRAARTRFDALDRMYRDGWRLGPAVGARFSQLQGLLGYVPPSQREPLLAVLHALDATQLDQLAMLDQRTPPPEREALREALLAQPAAARGAWLQRRLGR